MTTQQENKQVPSNDNILTTQEQAVCMKITKGEAPHSQRALALLALNEGSTQGQAADKSGLSAGQVKYWVTRFRNHRMGIFPDALLEGRNTKADTKIATEEIKTKSKASGKKADSAKSEKDKKNKKKGKKSGKKTDKTKKGEKKSKKDKKDKKGKKGKKPKKKAG